MKYLKYLLILLLLTPVNGFTDSKLTGLSTISTPSDDDIMYIVDAPAGAAVSKNVTISTLKTTFTGLLADDDYTDFTCATQSCTLDADVVDSAEIADDALDSEHYTNGSIDPVHLANADFGDFACVAGDCTLDATSVDISTRLKVCRDSWKRDR